MHTPLFKGIVQSCLGSVEAIELAAIWPPVQFGLKLNTNTIHGLNSFLPSLILPGRGFHTTTFHRQSWHRDLRVRLKKRTPTTVANKAQRNFADSTTFAGFLKISAVHAHFFFVHFFCPPMNFAFIPRYKIKSCSSAWMVPP